MCDIILASPTAVFGQPEVNIGIIPGAGGTQRLVRAIGKSRAMELVLTGRPFSAAEAAAWGLVSRVSEDVLADALALAGQIAGKGAVAAQAAKEAVNVAYEGSLAEGLRQERRLFHGMFATRDQKEGASCRLKCSRVDADSVLHRYGGVRGEAQADVDALVSEHWVAYGLRIGPSVQQALHLYDSLC